MNLLRSDAGNAEIAEACRRLRLSPMAEVICDMSAEPACQPSYREVAVKLLNAVIASRQNNRLQKSMEQLKLTYQDACLDGFYANHKGLNTPTAKELCCCEWILQRRNMLITGGTLSGKTWIGDMLSVSAVIKGFKVCRMPMFKFVLEIGTLGFSGIDRVITRMLRHDLIYLDGFGQQPLQPEESIALQQLTERAAGRCSILITTILDQKGWADIFTENQSSINNFESIYSRLTAKPSINIHLSNSYYKRGASVRAQSAEASSGSSAESCADGNSAPADSAEPAESFHKSPAKPSSASTQWKLNLSDKQADCDDFMKKNGPKMEAAEASMTRNMEVPQNGSSAEPDLTNNLTDGDKE